MDNAITGQTLIDWGFKPGHYFKEAIPFANSLKKADYCDEAIRQSIEPMVPAYIPMREYPERFYKNIEHSSLEEMRNVEAVTAHMTEIMKVPTTIKGSIMPDACPVSQKLGTMPVGCVVATKDAIHPGFHSADVCCSMAVTVIGDVDPKEVLDLGMRYSHFGPGGRNCGNWIPTSESLEKAFASNLYLRDSMMECLTHHGTQGDGNHFFYVGQLESTGQTCLVTHHGSRKPGANLFKAGMRVAEKFRKKLSPETPKHNAWIPTTEDEGQEYWQALKIIEMWTHSNHFCIHDLICEKLGIFFEDRFWNPHNFVFKRDDLYYHAKGATPSYYNADSGDNRTLIPMNMASPILVTSPTDSLNGIGFAPHGAGRNFSRKHFERQNSHLTPEQLIERDCEGIDVRFYNGNTDISELPSAYKNADQIVSEIERYGLANIHDKILPYGSIMAGKYIRPSK